MDKIKQTIQRAYNRVVGFFKPRYINLSIREQLKKRGITPFYYQEEKVNIWVILGWSCLVWVGFAFINDLFSGFGWIGLGWLLWIGLGWLVLSCWVLWLYFIWDLKRKLNLKWGSN